MDDRQIREPGGGYSPYPLPPPPRRGNTLRALSVLLGVALLAGFVLYGLQQIGEAIANANVDPVQEQINATLKQQTVIVQKRERTITYPQTPVEVADRFGGNPNDWSQNIWTKSWKYKSDTPIEIPCARNVSVYSTHLTLYWKV